jgi:hypothetical protein
MTHRVAAALRSSGMVGRLALQTELLVVLAEDAVARTVRAPTATPTRAPGIPLPICSYPPPDHTLTLLACCVRWRV